jgi:hypothetical protein
MASPMSARARAGGVVDGVAGHGGAQGLPRSRHSHDPVAHAGLAGRGLGQVGMTESASPTVQDAGSAMDAISR